jgi:hypothetical protein
MDRRAVLRWLGGTAAVTALPPDVGSLGRALHRRLGRGASLRVLDPHQDATVVAVTDLLLPTTETPGAKAARVNEFIDLLLAEWFDPGDRDRFLAGVAELDARARRIFGKAFLDAAAAEQAGLLTVLDDEAMRWHAIPEARRGPEPFYHQIKRLTLLGYYTSEIGAELEQHYQIIPGRYLPCAPADTAAGPA